MPVVTCPACREAIPAADVNVGQGIAFCRACGDLSKLTEMVELAEGERAIGEAPAGCSVTDDGVTMRVRASTRSVVVAIALGFFAAFWNGVVSVFVLVLAGSAWMHFGGQLPSWYPINPAGSGGQNSMPWPMLLFMSAFMTPFVGIGMFLLSMVAMSVLGHVEVRIRGGEGVVFTGVGPIGRRRRFDALNVKGVRMHETRGEDSRTRQIVIETDKVMKFGSMLKEPRQVWMAAVLRGVLVTGTAKG